MEEEEADDEEMGVAETYADYWPAKCKYLYEKKKIIIIFIKNKLYVYSEIREKTSGSSC